MVNDLTSFSILPIGIMIKINPLPSIIREYIFAYPDNYNQIHIMYRPNRFI